MRNYLKRPIEKSEEAAMYPQLEETKPPPMWQIHQHHWLHSERATCKTVAQWLNNKWYMINEAEPITPAELYRRGWLYYGPDIEPGRKYEDYAAEVQKGMTMAEYEKVRNGI